MTSQPITLSPPAIPRDVDPTAALVVSTDVEEVARICHRVLVFEYGRVSAELIGDQLFLTALTAVVPGL